MSLVKPDRIAQSEQTATSEHGNLPTSTFQGEPCRGRWIPILTKPKDGSPTITDWICPVCNRLLGQSRTCPKCGLEIQEIPVYKTLARPERERRSNYKLWMDEQLEAKDGRLSR
jgi:rubrerythrin